MRRTVIRCLVICLLVALGAGAYVGIRTFDVFQTAYGGFQHLRHLLESGETIEGAPADDVLSDGYLMSLFGDNPELVDRLKTVVDLGMATDANLKLGSVSAMIVTYRKNEEGTIQDAAIYAVGGFPDPKSKRLGFHSTGYFRNEVDDDLWISGNAVMNLLGRDVIVFCELDKAESHMALLFDLLNGGIVPLAQRIVDAPLYYSIVFPNPQELAPPKLRNKLQTLIIKGEMEGDRGMTETMFVSPNVRASTQVYTIVKDLIDMARITFHDRFSGFVKETSWGKMNDSWWAAEYVNMIDSLKLVHDQVIVVAKVEYDRTKNNAILKTLERAGRDMAMQKSFSLAGILPWEYAFNEKTSPSGGYWSDPHRWGSDWPLGDDGIPTKGSIAAAAERARLRMEQEELERLRREAQDQLQNAPPPAAAPGQAT